MSREVSSCCIVYGDGRIDMGVFLFKQKTAYEMRISYWSSDVCSSVLLLRRRPMRRHRRHSIEFKREIVQAHLDGETLYRQLGRASCRERRCQYVQIPVAPSPSKKTTCNEQTDIAQTRINYLTAKLVKFVETWTVTAGSTAHLYT